VFTPYTSVLPFPNPTIPSPACGVDDRYGDDDDDDDDYHYGRIRTDRSRDIPRRNRERSRVGVVEKSGTVPLIG
jgi:hypothetical protein